MSMSWNLLRWAVALVAVAACHSGGNRADGETERPAVMASAVPAGVNPGSSGGKGGAMSLMEALSKRRSIRRFGRRPLTEKELMDLLWAGQGVSSDRGLRTAPSAGATYPLEIHLLTAKGVSRYNPKGNQVVPLAADDRMARLAQAALGQSCVRNAGANFVIGGVIARTAARYGDRAERYVIFEAGAAAENMLLRAVSLGLGGVVVGAYDDDRVRDIARLPKDAVPLAIVSVGALE